MWSRLGVLLIAAAPLFAQAPKDSLATLIQLGNRKAALEQIRAGADVNAAQPDGTRPIHWAVFRVDHELLQALIAKKAAVNVANEFGATPIAEAAKLADAAAVKMLLDAGAEPDGPNDDGQTALMLAIKTGDLSIVDMLLKAGAKVNVAEKLDNQTPLMWAAAAEKNAPEMVKMLLAKGASVKARAKFTDWPSQITSEPRAQYRPTGGLTPLLYAARAGCYDCVLSILDAGADINLPTPEGVTPLIMALDNEHIEIGKLLLDRGANPSVWDWWGRTPLYVVVDRKAASGGGRGGRGGAAPAATGAISHMTIINALLEAGVNSSPELSFHRPSRGGNSGRFGEGQLSTGATPLFRAAQANDTEVMRALLAKGANPNVSAMGFTPFMLVAGVTPGGRGGGPGGAPNTQLLDAMIQNGANVNAQVTGTLTYTGRVSRSPSTNEGQSALHAAAQGGRTELVKYLLSKGANPDILDGQGRKPIDVVGLAVQTAPAGRGGAANAANAAASAEIRALLQAAKK